MQSRIAVISGAAQGIGKAIAKRCFDDGYRVALLDNNLKAVEATAQEISPKSCLALQCDVCDPAQVEAAANSVKAKWGNSEIVISNVGWSPSKTFLEMTHEEERRIVDINLFGSLYIARSFLPHLVEAKGGRLIFIGSDAGRVGAFKESVYAATKAGLVGLAKSLAVELSRQNITVNVVSPGSTDTELLHAIHGEEALEKRRRAIPMQRFGKPEDMAGAVSFLVGPDASYITGQVFSVNGGTTRAD